MHAECVRRPEVRLSLSVSMSTMRTTVRPTDRPSGRCSLPAIYGRFPGPAGSRAISVSLRLHSGHFRLKAPCNLLTRHRINAIRCESAGANVSIYINLRLNTSAGYYVFFLLAALNCTDLRWISSRTERTLSVTATVLATSQTETARTKPTESVAFIWHDFLCPAMHCYPRILSILIYQFCYSSLNC